MFKGSEKIKEKENHQYDPRINVFFQANAWLDTSLSMLWLEEVFEPWQKNVLAGTDLLVLMDNLRIQKNGEYIRKLQSLGAEALFGPPGKTEAWQPIDAGHLGAMIKDIAKEKFNQYLDHNDIMTGECRWETCN